MVLVGETHATFRECIFSLGSGPTFLTLWVTLRVHYCRARHCRARRSCLPSIGALSSSLAACLDAGDADANASRAFGAAAGDGPDAEIGFRFSMLVESRASSRSQHPEHAFSDGSIDGSDPTRERTVDSDTRMRKCACDCGGRFQFRGCFKPGHQPVGTSRDPRGKIKASNTIWNPHQ